MLRELPIIFSGESVRALLSGTKTVTRRVVEPQPHAGVRRSPFVPSGLEDGHGREIRVRFRPGDRLWVREAWLAEARFDAIPPREIPPGSELFYPAGPWNGEDMDLDRAAGLKFGRWRSPIHMPRWASRLTAEVVDTRVEQLHAFTIADLDAEGIDLEEGQAHNDFADAEHASIGGVSLGVYRDPETYAFAAGWDRLNARRGYSWESNPWVWRIEFRMTETTP